MSFILLGILNSQASGAVAGGPAFDLLETEILASSASSVTFTGLDSYTDYKHLQIRVVAQGNFPSTNNTTLSLRFNADSGANYARHRLNGSGSAVSSNATTSATSIGITEAMPNLQTNIFGAAVIDILDYANTNKNKTIRALAGALNTGETDISLASGAWFSTSAITEIELLLSSFNTNSRFSLYGIKG